MLLRAEMPKPATYRDLIDAPAGFNAELIAGTLYLHPRPRGHHIGAASALGAYLVPPFQFGEGGPGGWWILDEPEVHFELNKEVAVPDLAGWRCERLPELPADHRFRIIPDWVCEIVSTSTDRHDRTTKRPLYARYGVGYLWLVDPDARTLETYVRDWDAFELVSTFQGDEVVAAEPFAACPFCLARLWS